MSKLSRAFLIAMAVAFVTIVFSLGTSFTSSAESAERAYGAEWFWLLLAIVFASPLWVPAVFATRSHPVGTVICLLSAGALVIPLRYAGAVTLHQLRLYPDPLFSMSIFVGAAILSAGCVVAIVILLWASLRRMRRKPPEAN
jgi:uncharacterized protein (DUF2062 family)